MTYHFKLPDCVYLPRKTMDDRKVMLNMNRYHTLHPHVRNQMKQLFEPISIEPFKAEKIRVSYFVHKKSKRKYDSMNVVSVVDKCFLDWLVKNNYIPDDTCENVVYGEIAGIREAKSNFVSAYIEVIK